MFTLGRLSVGSLGGVRFILVLVLESRKELIRGLLHRIFGIILLLGLLVEISEHVLLST